MTASIILKEIRALPRREKTKLMKEINRERELAEEQEDVRLFDDAVRDTVNEKPVDLRKFLKQAKIKA
ncbi:MAG: hypothetical protein M3Y82_07915 [Verrucomicrobiota bacterium]|nr:hypothetical protein [Verrucomicrobiota bacterium]